MTDVYPVTTDGRYFVVRGRLWRRSNPALPPATAQALVNQLMAARRELAGKDLSAMERASARASVDAAKRALGERGDAWWDDGAPDLTRHMVRTTSYADWFDALPKNS